MGYMNIVSASLAISGQTVFAGCKLGKLPIPDPPICKNNDFDGNRVYRAAFGEYQALTCDIAKAFIFKTGNKICSYTSTFGETAFKNYGQNGKSARLDLP